jgi:predicted  nucleic acid-binding Zn ribbon protein
MGKKMHGCPACGGIGMLLGQLGRLFWFRCRQCGIDFSSKKG